MSRISRKATLIAACAVAISLLLIAGWRYLASPQEPPSAQAVDPSTLVRAYSPSEGRADAPVVIVEFFDPACGTCRDFYPLVKELMAAHPGRIRLVMRYTPFHTGSDKVVAVLAAAQRQGKFWPALEALFDSQSDWASNHIAKVDLALKHLQGTGLNMEQLAFDLSAPELQQALDQDMRDANALGVSQTPEYFVNGRPLPTFGIDPLRALVAQELSKAH